jgi:hypothetical protein
MEQEPKRLELHVDYSQAARDEVRRMCDEVLERRDRPQAQIDQ